MEKMVLIISSNCDVTPCFGHLYIQSMIQTQHEGVLQTGNKDTRTEVTMTSLMQMKSIQYTVRVNKTAAIPVVPLRGVIHRALTVEVLWRWMASTMYAAMAVKRWSR